MEDANAEVLIAGAGPTGLSLACALARQGIVCRVVEKQSEPAGGSRAIAVHARTLEMLDSIDVAETLISRGRRLYGTNGYADGERIVHVAFDELDSPYPFVLVVPQSDTERVLAARAQSLGVKIDRGATLDAVTHDPLGVDAVITHANGRIESAHAAYLVGCDGEHSAVRKAVGVAFEGHAYEEHFALADVRMRWDLPSDETHVFFSYEGPFGAFPLLGENRWRIVAATRDVATPFDATTLETTVKTRTGLRASVEEVTWTAPFQSHRRLASSFREGRVFLAGDSAHIHSPIGGQGMNTGIQDAFNLAWKLALVQRGRGRPRLLESYAAERRPVAALTIAGTDLATRVVTLRSVLAREIRDHVATYLSSLETVQARMVASASETAVHYRGSPIVDEFRTSVARSKFLADRSNERPSMADWVEFSEAPAPGERARDAALMNGDRLFEWVHGPHHLLALFDGAAATAAGYRNFVAIADAVRAKFGDRVLTRMIVPAHERPEILPDDDTVWLDPGGVLHRLYGAGSECLFFFRPDGYVGFRSQPAAGDPLLDYLDSVLTSG